MLRRVSDELTSFASFAAFAVKDGGLTSLQRRGVVNLHTILKRIGKVTGQTDAT